MGLQITGVIIPGGCVEYMENIKGKAGLHDMFLQKNELIKATK